MMRLASTRLDPLADEAAAAVRSRWDCAAETAMILGTGLGDLADEIEAQTSMAYREIPHFPRSTALAHKGLLLCGRLAGVPVIAMQGRSHLYEGHRLDDLMLPVRMLRRLGVQRVLVTNAAGGINPRFVTGDVMLIDDHINLMGHASRPLAPQTDDHRGRPYYDERLLQAALAT